MVKVSKYLAVAKKLEDSSVGIAGLGGLGSNVAMALARAGVGRLVLVDFDKVEEGNLNRQAYFRDQVGMLKTEALRKNIQSAMPEAAVEVKNLKLAPGQMHLPFRDVDVVVEALDNAATKAAFIEEIMIKLPGIPVVAASGVAGYGASDRIETRKSGMLHLVHDNMAKPSDEDVLLAPKVGLFAHWQANIVLEILLEDVNVD